MTGDGAPGVGARATSAAAPGTPAPGAPPGGGGGATLLVTLTGHDRPGVTAALFAALAGTGVDVVDVEQVVVRGRLVLGVLLAPEAGPPGSDRSADGAGSGHDLHPALARARAAARGVAGLLGLDVETVPGAAESDARRRGRLRVTVIGSPLTPDAVSALAAATADLGANIDKITRVAAYPVTAVEMEVSGARPGPLRAVLAEQAVARRVDVAVQPLGLARRGQRLVVMDVDSTLIQDEVVELLAAHAGCADRVAAITGRAMRGELDFAESLAERVALLAGLPEGVFDEVRAQVRLTPGARTLCRTLRRLGYHLAAVSGGFTQVVAPLAADLGIAHVRANELEVVDGRLTGRVVGPVVDRAGKAAALAELAALHGLPLERTVAVGDGANDIDMLVRAGLGVAFNAKPVVRSHADAAVSVPYLDAVLFLLGIPREEVEAADAGDAGGADAAGEGGAGP